MRRALGLFALAALVGAAACSTDTTPSAFSGATTPALNDVGASGGTGTVKPIVDAGVVPVAPYRGNPLCNTDVKTCIPDDDTSQVSSTPHQACAVVTTPDGDAEAVPTPSKACRLETVDGGVAPNCFDTTAATGIDGTKCEKGEQCAPGFDCVASEDGNRACRHYCCAGTCKAQLSNGSTTFCDVQSLVEVNQKAPVCMPIKHCSTLLGTGECSPTETCSVVTEDGDTGCVAIGDKQVGESCDDAHCANDLACLGQPGARTCFKLCKVSGADCPSSQTCVGSASFKDADYGICN